MKAAELQAFSRQNYLNDGYEEVLDQARPYFAALIAELSALPEDAPRQVRLAAFQRCIEGLNAMGDDIETVERECLCAALYAIGDIVGLDATSQFVDNWRGDW